MIVQPWVPPDSRYYYAWYGPEYDPNTRSDLDIKQEILDRIRGGPYDEQYDISVDVKKHVVILTGKAKSTVAKRAAGDDAWDTEGVVDVSNQIEVSGIPGP
ncbi:MAG TPA: BON domain-containing protein [Actinomycetota bacterium]